MPHQCVHCGKIIEEDSDELLKGCNSCGGKFFYYIKEEDLGEIKEVVGNLSKKEKIKIEKDIREITGIDDEEEKPVILDLESIRALKPGKFEIDVVNLFSKKRPLIYKFEEGKYIIDLAESLKIA